MEALIFNEQDVDKELVPLYRPSVPYPPRAQDLGIEGLVIAELVVGIDGNVESVMIKKSPHPSLSNAVKNTIQRWRFQPAEIKGIPVRVRRIQEIDFENQ